MNKLVVVWICHLSNQELRNQLSFNKWTVLAVLRRIFGRMECLDFAVWNKNAIKEFEKFDDIELHVVMPHYHISGIQEFSINGIYYHVFETEDDNILTWLKYRFSSKIKTSYTKNSKLIKKIIDEINPDIIHMIGAENPYYGESALLLPNEIPFIVTPQTLMMDPSFKNNYQLPENVYNYRSYVESLVLKRADYIGSKVEHFRNILGNSFSYLDISLPVGEENFDENLDKSCDKIYDFVYFAADISKAVDYAIEAFAISKELYPFITLHVVGGYDKNYISKIRQRLKDLKIEQSVDFTGSLQTHDDVINEIKKSKFAILPLKVDLISGTIREAMSNGIPVVTTITPATPKFNIKRESILLSEKGDFYSMSKNMCRLIADKSFAEQIRQNALLTIKERVSNADVMREWKDRYFEICSKKVSNY